MPLSAYPLQRFRGNPSQISTHFPETKDLSVCLCQFCVNPLILPSLSDMSLAVVGNRCHVLSRCRSPNVVTKDRRQDLDKGIRSCASEKLLLTQIERFRGE